ncbi:MAG: hypothetical protein ACJAYZ_001205 [Bacteroidia bacterium]|jgi:hypothetical protein
MTPSGLNFIQRLVAYVLFISIVIRFISCQLSKSFTTERQVEEFRYYSFAGFVGVLIAIGTSFIIGMPHGAILYLWIGFFIVEDVLEKKFQFSKLFKK